jgi:O-antigen ligase
VALESLWQTHGLGLGLGVTSLHGVWTRVLAEAGVVGFVFYGAFFLSVLRDLYRVRRSTRVVVSNVSFVSMAVFLVLVSQSVENPYSAYVWVWYALWALFGSTARKKVTP